MPSPPSNESWPPPPYSVSLHAAVERVGGAAAGRRADEDIVSVAAVEGVAHEAAGDAVGELVAGDRHRVEAAAPHG